jgi:RNA-directed DNA polymerase
MNHYGAFYRSALYPLLARINAYLIRWLRHKYKQLRGRKMAQRAWAEAVATRPRVLRPLGMNSHHPRRLVTRTTTAV